jgi:prolyl oligopeptidase
VEQLFATSKDGTRVPFFVEHAKGLARNGAPPTILYGYGGFDVSQTPVFSPSIYPWLERGGVWVVANLPGGGEYGWLSSGRMLVDGSDLLGQSHS